MYDDKPKCDLAKFGLIPHWANYKPNLEIANKTLDLKICKKKPILAFLESITLGGVIRMDC